MQRSDFLRTTGIASLTVLGGAVCITPLLTGCAAGKYIDGTEASGTITVPLSAFTDQPSAIVRKTGMMKGPIHVVRNSDNTFVALSLLCTHKGCVVRPVGNAFECPCHGSEFDSKGAVLSPPAKEPLVQYATTTDGTYVHIKL
ncbi:MAG: Rieske 2Fe-2S domain-containing protein [bacterium]|nr:Rieske 2Fe-2S domain-containing protein [bacterium]